MNHDLPRLTRRRLMVAAGAALAAGPLVLATSEVRAGGQTPKTDVGYQYTPKGDQRCGLCASFIAGSDPAGPGTCQIVAGPIPPTGWCQLWSKR